jgi:hypothetical protein
VKDLGEEGVDIVLGNTIVAKSTKSSDASPSPAAGDIDEKPCVGATDADTVSNAKSCGTQSNAYMLLYRRVSDTPPVAPVVPDRLAVEANADNAAFQRLQAAFEIRQRMVELEVYLYDCRDGGSVSISEKPAYLDLPQSTLLIDATDAVSLGLRWLQLCVIACVFCGWAGLRIFGGWPWDPRNFTTECAPTRVRSIVFSTDHNVHRATVARGIGDCWPGSRKIHGFGSSV